MVTDIRVCIINKRLFEIYHQNVRSFGILSTILHIKNLILNNLNIYKYIP